MNAKPAKSANRMIFFARFAGCAFRSRCSHADETCAREIPRKSAGAAHDYLCRLAPNLAEPLPA